MVFLADKLKPVLLCVLDGFGYRAPASDNAISVAKAPFWNKLWENHPHALLDASGLDVGLPAGQMGNSEVGHMNIGAGRVVYQDLPLIDRAIESGELASNPALFTFIDKMKASGGTCHLMGLTSEGGVHSHTNHIVALAGILSKAGVPTSVHAFLDGRDVPPQSGAEHIGKLEDLLAPLAGVKLATVCGRYYAMDRDKRWARVELAYKLLAQGEGARVPSAVDAIESSYADGVYDEFVLPICMNDYKGMSDNDGILFANFRADRAREILSALLDPAFTDIDRGQPIRFAAALGMVEYSTTHKQWMQALFEPKVITNTLGEVVANAGFHQLRIAETEKYPHVTFFFNGGREEPYPNEDRTMIPSPKVATYDLQPEMSARSVTDKVIEAIKSDKFELIVLNYANGDMVGHTGSLEAAVRAVETLDSCLERMLTALDEQGGVALITADHGNCEMMYDPETKGPHTAHTLSPVPVVLFSSHMKDVSLRNGRLADIAPTLLSLLKLSQPSEMTGKSLIEN